MGKDVISDIKDNFRNEGLTTDSSFKKWTRSKSAIKRLNQGFSLRTTLIDTGKLMRSQKYEVEKNNLKIGFNTSEVPYGVEHNDGIGQIRRQFLYLRKSIIKKVLVKADDYLKK